MTVRADPVVEVYARVDRIRAFDLARGLAVVFMIMVHVLRHWGDPATWSTPIGTLISFLGGPPAAPVFMFLMGASMAFSSRISFTSLARRGLSLVAAGYLLNVFRGTVPLSAGLATGIVTSGQVTPFTPFSLLTMVDILQLAGCSLILMAALREVARPGRAWLAVAAAIVLIAPLLHGRVTGMPVPDALLGMLWATGDNIFYPVFPWLVFPLVGAVIGASMAQVEAGDRRAVLRRAGAIGSVACASGVALIVVAAPTLDVVTYWRLPPVLVPSILGFVVAWVWLCDVIARRAGPSTVLAAIYDWSGRVTAMYVVHWLIVSWGIAIVGFRVMELWPVLTATVVVLVATIVISRWRPRLPGLFGLGNSPAN